MLDAKVAPPKMWAQALTTVPNVDVRQVDAVSRWLILMRASVLVMTVISAIIGGLLAVRGEAFHAGLFALTALGLVLCHAASNLTNDMWDFWRGVDTPDSPRATYGPHIFAHAAGSWRAFLLVTGGILLAAAVIGLFLTLVSGPGVLVFVLIGAGVLLLYSGGPLPLKYFGLGEVAVFIIWGPVMIGGTYYVMAKELPLWVVVASLPYAFGVTSVLMGKHIDKLSFDTAHHIRTLPQLLGEARARRLTQAFMASMYLSTLAVAAWQRMPGLLLVLAALPIAWRLFPLFSSPKPAEPPEGYPGWPLWFVAFAFIHNRHFGLLFVGGLTAQVVGEVIYKAVTG
jgi:1,4-dihydroxy-2-naphthoate octaprenyltransferase